MDKIELKPCPFCLGEAGLQKEYYREALIGPYWVAYCHRCPVRNTRTSKDEAIAAWNRRPAPSVEGLSVTVPPEWVEAVTNVLYAQLGGHLSPNDTGGKCLDDLRRLLSAPRPEAAPKPDEALRAGIEREFSIIADALMDKPAAQKAWIAVRGLLASTPPTDQGALREAVEKLAAKYQVESDKPDSIGGYCCSHADEYARKDTYGTVADELRAALTTAPSSLKKEGV